MRHRRSNANAVSAKLVEYLVTRRNLAQNEIADILEVDKSFVSRVRKAERDFSSRQMQVLADHFDVPLGAMMIDALRPAAKPATGERKELIELCERLLMKAGGVATALRVERAERASRRAAAADADAKAVRRQPPSAA